MSNFAWIGPLAAATALPLVFGILRALFPVRPAEGTERRPEELDREYGRWRVAGYLIWFFIFTPLAGYFCWEAFCKYGDHVAAELPGRLLPKSAGWPYMVPAGRLLWHDHRRLHGRCPLTFAAAAALQRVCPL